MEEKYKRRNKAQLADIRQIKGVPGIIALYIFLLSLEADELLFGIPFDNLGDKANRRAVDVK